MALGGVLVRPGFCIPVQCIAADSVVGGTVITVSNFLCTLSHQDLWLKEMLQAEE